MNNPRLNTILNGSSTVIPEPLSLKAGLTDLIFQDGMIRQIAYNSTPICNRIYFALRDHYWNTIPGSFTIIHHSITPTGFAISFKGIYKQDTIELESLFDLRGNSSGEIQFSFKALAHTSFYRNRIGFCTLLPIDHYRGKTYRVIRSDNKVISSTFPDIIEPWQPQLDIKSISMPIDTSSNLTISFDGDLFEMEDQRNWTDYSYKIYSTRLSDPLPVPVERGTTIEQKITFTIIPPPHAPDSPCDNKQNTPIILDTLSLSTCKVPQIGTCLDCPKQYTISPEYISQFSYIRFDIFFDQPDHRDIILSIISTCRTLSITPEFAIYCTNDIQKELALFKECLSVSGIKPVRIIVHLQSETIVSETTITTTRALLDQSFPGVPLVFGTDRYFVELNRSRDVIDLCDHICYSLNPQVHTFDNESIMENLPGIESTILTSHTLFGNKKVHITPITLRPRTNRSNPHKAGGPDMRLYGLFGAAWTAGALFYSIRKNVDALCFFDLNGDHGIFDNIRKNVTPAYHLLSKVASFSGGYFHMIASGNPKSVIAFHLEKENRLLFVIANLTNTNQTMEIKNQMSGKAQIIDKLSFEQLCADYTKWEKQSQQVTYTNEITLSEYAVLLIERDL